MKFSTGILITAGLLSSFTTQAAQRAVRRSPASSLTLDQLKALYAAEAADVSCANVTQRYRSVPSANDLLRAFALQDRYLRGDRAPKGEFETSADFQKRMQLSDGNILGHTATVFIKINLVSFDAEYNADDSTMSVNLGDHDQDLHSDAIDIGLAEFSTEDYIGINSFGAARIVDKTRSISLRAISKMPGTFGHVKNRIDPYAKGYRLTLSANDARDFKARPSVFIVGKLAPSVFRKALVSDKPTLDNPSDYRSVKYGFEMEIDCVGFYAGNKVLPC